MSHKKVLSYDDKILLARGAFVIKELEENLICLEEGEKKKRNFLLKNILLN